MVRSQTSENKNKTYWENNKESLKYSFKAFKASIYFLIHAFIPNKFKTKGSREVSKIHNEILLKKTNLYRYLG